MPTSDQIGGLVRIILSTLGGIIVANGYITDANWQIIVGIVVAIITGAWSIWTNRTTGMIVSVSQKPEVKLVVTTPTIAAATPDAPKVVAGTPSEIQKLMAA